MYFSHAALGGGKAMLLLFLCVLSEDDQDKIEQIFKDHHLMMYRISMKMLQSDSDAEDAVAQAFLSIMEHFGKISQLPGPQITPYCVVIVKNASYDILRKKNRLFFLDENWEAEDDTQNVEEQILKAADTKRLLEAMRKLPDADRYLMELHFAKEMGYKEIAAVLGVNEDAAKKRGQRVLKKLRLLYEEGERNG